jgi:LacI family transcriptional regulator
MNKEVRIAVMLDKSGSYDRGLFKGIVQYPDVSSPWVFFFDAPDYAPNRQNEKLLYKLKMWEPDCIVTRPTHLVPKLKELGVPIIVTAAISKIDGVINIIADDEKIGHLGAMYLMEKGFKNLAFYGTDKIYWSKNRKIAFKKEVISKGLNFFEAEALLLKEWQNNPYRLKSWIGSLPKPVAIMACQDDFGIQIIEAVKMTGFKIPFDVAVLGVDNDLFICNLYNPPMSSIDQESETVGYAVAKYIQSFVDGHEQLPNEIVGKVFRVVSRLSTDVIAVEDNELKKALLYIKKNAGKKNISVDEVVGETFLSRRPLEMRFRKTLGRSILQEISRVRINFACNLLRNTCSSISEIAYLMGFSSPTSFSNFFKKEINCSCKEYRDQFHGYKMDQPSIPALQTDFDPGNNLN